MVLWRGRDTIMTFSVSLGASASEGCCDTQEANFVYDWNGNEVEALKSSRALTCTGLVVDDQGLVSDFMQFPIRTSFPFFASHGRRVRARVRNTIVRADRVRAEHGASFTSYRAPGCRGAVCMRARQGSARVGNKGGSSLRLERYLQAGVARSRTSVSGCTRRSRIFGLVLEPVVRGKEC